MRILHFLAKHPVFKALAQVQAYLDDRDDVLSQGPMTRSPYHLVAFLISWKLTDDSSKQGVLKRLQAISARTPFKLANLQEHDLDDLIESIDWHELFNELREVQPDFLQLVLPPKLVDAVNSQDDGFFTVLKDKIIPGKDDNIIKIITSLSQESPWKTPFEERYCPLLERRTWLVESDTYALAPSL